MNTFSAHWFDGVTSRMHEVTVTRDGAATVHIAGEGIQCSAALGSLRVSPRLGRTPRTIEFADGARLLVADHPLLDDWFPAEDRLQRLVDRLERHASIVAGSIVVCLASLVVAVVWGIPWLSDRIAEQIPVNIEAKLGEGVLEQLDKRFGFEPSELESTREAELRARFDRVVAAAGASAGQHCLEFRRADDIGANALALPGGTIVVTDALIDALSDDRAFDAIVAHELGHQHHRHTLRQTLRSSFVIVLAAFFAGDVSAASSVVVGVPTFLLQNHYSRGFEEESDRYAFATLEAMGESPAWFAEAMRNLKSAHEDYGDEVKYLSTHPSDDERIEAAEAAGKGFLERHPDKVREVPGYDACAQEGICEDECEDCEDGESECTDDEVDPDTGLCPDTADCGDGAVDPDTGECTDDNGERTAALGMRDRGDAPVA